MGKQALFDVQPISKNYIPINVISLSANGSEMEDFSKSKDDRDELNGKLEGRDDASPNDSWDLCNRKKSSRNLNEEIREKEYLSGLNKLDCHEKDDSLVMESKRKV